MVDTIDSYCGIKCYDCDRMKNNSCTGCKKGRIGNINKNCKVAECAEKNKKNFCGDCEDFACKLLKDISTNSESGDKGHRIERCKQLKSDLVREARDGINPISFCGHHCDYCFIGKWCGGCRSNYNCCSYAGVFENNKCPNVECAKTKNLEGCYECDELEQCKKGFYSKEDEYVAKATALFIKKYGQDTYTRTLKNAIDNGENYPKSFDKTRSIKKALELLEKYIL